MPVAPDNDSSDPFGLGAAEVDADPTLMAADPTAMSTMSAQFSSAAHQMYELFQTTSTAAGLVLKSWKGDAANAFSISAQTQDFNSQAAAEALIGVSGALHTLSGSIMDAQQKVRQAQQLASGTNAAIAHLNNQYATTSGTAVAHLAPGVGPAAYAAAVRPTAQQTAQAEALQADIRRVQTLVTEANQEAERAWKLAAFDFDAVTAQSPSVDNQLEKAHVDAFNKTVGAEGVLVIATLLAGSLDGGGEDDDDVGDDEGINLDDPTIAKEIEEAGLNEGENLTVDGTKLDEDIAVVFSSNDIDNKIITDEDAALGDVYSGTDLDHPDQKLNAKDFPYLKPPYEESYGATPGRRPAAEPVTVGEAPDGWPELTVDAQKTFQGPVEPTAAVGGVTYYRVVSDGQYPAGSFWSTTPPDGTTRDGLAIKGNWNSITGVVEFTPKEGETIPGWTGATAPQGVTMPDGTPGYYPGGENQIWVEPNAFNTKNGWFTIHKFNG